MVFFGGFKRFSKKMCVGGTPWYPPTLCAPCYCSYWLIGRHCNYCRRYDITIWPGETCNTWAMTMIIIIVVNDVTKSLFEGRVCCLGTWVCSFIWNLFGWFGAFKPNLQRAFLLYNLQSRCWQIFLAKKLKKSLHILYFEKISQNCILSVPSVLFCSFESILWKSGLAASSVISGGIWVRKDLTKYSSLSLMRDLKCNPKYSEQSFRIWEYQSD